MYHESKISFIGTVFIISICVGKIYLLDPCYNQDNKATKCVPDFVNAAYGNNVVASSTCGINGPERLCEKNDFVDKEGTCRTCNNQNADQKFPSSSLTDLNNPSNITCWRSAMLNPLTTNENITLNLSFGKAYELTYVSLQVCPNAVKPDSLAIYKSMDFGYTWQPFQYFSSECRKMYDMPNQISSTVFNEDEARCSDSHNQNVGSRIAFSTLEGRPSASDFDNSKILQEWTSATNIKVVFNRMFKNVVENDNEINVNYDNPKNNENTNSIPVDQHYAISDLAVGGRCKCNGHASQCIKDSYGNLVCECKHNTAGKDCERCKMFYSDKPWGRATDENANECQACNCNGHSKQCRFNNDLYKLSGKASGGVCVNCRHFTSGRHCHYCREGYYRDPLKTLNHKKICKPCDCHPIGSLGKVCNNLTGQCQCKEGVTGLSCNKCAANYKQSRSQINPCIKEISNIVSSEVYSGDEYDQYNGDYDEMDCSRCEINSKKLILSQLCKFDYVILAKIHEVIDLNEDEENDESLDSNFKEFSKLKTTIQAIFKQKSNIFTKHSMLSILVSRKELRCGCLKIKSDRPYLFVGNHQSTPSVILEWKDLFYSKLRRYQARLRQC